MSEVSPSVCAMKKFATVTALRPRDEAAAHTQPADDAAIVAYWERVQSLRAELADLAGAG